jgi:bifunctional non-homologous end joining protein LigD
MGLDVYKHKRDFTKTHEPAGRQSLRSRLKRLGENHFVIQKHAASRLHYDFRLEMEGVLVSWAVPKGIPTEQGDRRLAIHVEDHPIEYGKFEGTIPHGNYGAGTVMLWDKGTYESLEGDPEKALASGKLVVRLDGKKLKGQWTLVQMKRADEPDGGPWLLIKTQGAAKPVSARQDDRSVESGRTMKQIGEGRGKVWKSNRSKSPSLTTSRRRSIRPRDDS